MRMIVSVSVKTWLSEVSTAMSSHIGSVMIRFPVKEMVDIGVEQVNPE